MLTEKMIDRLPPGRHRDGKMPGLEIVIHASGAKSWAYRYRTAGRSRNITLARYPNVTPQDARRAAQKIAGEVACGRDPGAERKAARKAVVIASAPVRDLIEPVLKRYLRHAKARTRPSTYRETSRAMAKEVLPHWRGRRLSEVTRQDVRQLISAIAKRTKKGVSGNRALASLKTLFAWAVSEDLIIVNPCAAIRPPAAETARERVLLDSELSAVLEACAGLGMYGAGVRLLALTGQRRSEVFGALWSEFDLAAKVWTLPAARAKNGRQHSIPLSAQALAILESLKSPKLGNLVFEPQSFSRCKAQLDAAISELGSNLPPWCVHDLRRTAASGLAALGVQLPVIEKVLNHQRGSFRGVCGVYQRHSYAAEKRAALDAWAAHVAALPVCPVALAKAA